MPPKDTTWKEIWRFIFEVAVLVCAAGILWICNKANEINTNVTILTAKVPNIETNIDRLWEMKASHEEVSALRFEFLHHGLPDKNPHGGEVLTDGKEGVKNN